MSTIIITGGCGYIGSHTAIEILNQGKFEVVSIDSLVNSRASVLDRIESITGKRMVNHAVDLCDREATRAVFQQYDDIAGVIHFAALKAVGESVEKPLWYYHNNFGSLINVVECCRDFGVKNFIFSSSCSIYGNVDKLPVSEDTPTSEAESPYAHTKLVGEQMLKSFVRSNDEVQIIALRYFNPVGSHPSGQNGELPLNKPSNLVPVITLTAVGRIPQMTVFGGEYDTRDGTCIRDYIHVVDIAQAHIDALEFLLAGKNEKQYDVFNLGTGKGVSVLEAIQAFEQVAGQPLNYRIGDPRPGDVVAIYSDSSKAEQMLGWKPQFDINDMMASAWKWQQQLESEQQ
jgi:UDP-glucose 4-epimerase